MKTKEIIFLFIILPIIWVLKTIGVGNDMEEFF